MNGDEYRNRNGDEHVWESGEPLAELVRRAVEGTTYGVLTERGVDPKSGYRLPKSTLWRIANAQPVKINPALVRAVATAIGEPVRIVQLAAAQQYVGLVADDPLNASTEEAQVVIAHVPGMKAEDMPRAQEILRQWVAGERGEHTDGLTHRN